MTARMVLFDVDGVLLDSLPAYRAAWARWSAETGIGEAAIWAVAHGRRPVDIVSTVAPGELDQHRWLDRFGELIAEQYRHVPAMPGAQRLLAALPTTAWAVVTSGDRDLVLAAFARLGLSTVTKFPQREGLTIT